MAVPANVVVAWPSTVASIPSGWTRVTELDSRYIVGASPGADADLATDRGNASHAHTSPNHTPTQNSHTHVVTDGGYNGPDVLIQGGTPVRLDTDGTHGHGSGTSAAQTATNNGIAITVNATTNDLTFTAVIWIKSDGTPTGLPAGCYAFWSNDSFPSGWSRAAAGKYLKGAAPAGDGGGSGGSNTHAHTSPAHTHTQNSHSHGWTSNGPDVTAAAKQGASVSPASDIHTHAVDLVGATATNQSVTTTINSSNHEPPFTFLNAMSSGSMDLPVSVICVWVGTNAGIPSGWSRYGSLDDRWSKNSAVDGDVLTTGGATTHTHTASSCQPIQDAHTHTASDPGPSTTVNTASGLVNHASATHTHAWSVDNTTATNNAVAVTIDASSVGAAYPPYRTVIFIQFNGAGPVAKKATITSYDLNLFDIGSPHTGLLPEAEHRIAAGDLRYLPH